MVDKNFERLMVLNVVIVKSAWGSAGALIYDLTSQF